MPTSVKRRVAVHLLPELAGLDDLAGAAVVVIDVLRATTTMIYALAAGATAIQPCVSVEEARSLQAGHPAGTSVLGGERGGIRIEGFDLGNSPGEYTTTAVAGKQVIMTTTNGTRALATCGQARLVLLAGFVNLQAVVRRLRDEQVVHILCAGTRRQISGDDTLVAGALVERLATLWRAVGAGAVDTELNDAGQLALTAWKSVADETGRGDLPALDLRIAASLRQTQGGRDLLELGFHADIALASAVDRFDRVVEFDRATGRILLC